MKAEKSEVIVQLENAKLEIIDVTEKSAQQLQQTITEFELKIQNLTTEH